MVQADFRHCLLYMYMNITMLSLLSLTALKVMIGIVLMGKASDYQYVNSQVSKNEANQTEQRAKRKGSASESRAGATGIPGAVSEPTTIPRESNKTKARTTKSLSDIERFTLCSNRIV